MTITGTIRTKAVRTSYPSTSGLTAETTKTYDREMNLIPEKGSVMLYNKKKMVK